MVIDNEGDIVTNRHVVENSETARVRASSGKTFSAAVVGTSSDNDLAVVQVQGAKLPAATPGDSSKLRVGDVVLAVGNPLGLESSVTDGIVSALGRTVTTASFRDVAAGRYVAPQAVGRAERPAVLPLPPMCLLLRMGHGGTLRLRSR